MIQIRRGVFETNSSSTHSICIVSDTNTPLVFPKSLRFECREFGWEWRTLSTMEDKAAYLYAAILSTCERDAAEKITTGLADTLWKHGVKCNFETPDYDDDGYVWNAGIDHSEEVNVFLHDVLCSEDTLLRYLFSDLSFVKTGNDNSDGDIGIHVDYPHEEYYKRN